MSNPPVRASRSLSKGPGPADRTPAEAVHTDTDRAGPARTM